MDIPPDSGSRQPYQPSAQDEEPANVLPEEKPGSTGKRKISPKPAERTTPQPKRIHSETPALKGISPNQQLPEDAVYFIDDDTQRQQILEDCRQKKNGPVILLRSPADLDHHNLLQTVTSPGEGRCDLFPGRLFGEQPLTLVLDLTAMSPGQIASLNDLLAQPHSFQGKPLGTAVQLIALVSPEMLKSGPGKPGPDCWRRLQAFRALYPADDPSRKSLAEKAAPAVKSNDTLLQERVSGFHKPTMEAARLTEPLERLQLSSSTEIIDFAGGSAWRTRLFGGLALNERGKLCFMPGQLAGLGENQKVILRDAPWDDPDFVAALTTVLREGGFEANGARVSLPDSLKYSREDTSPEAVAALRQQWCNPLSPGAITPDSVVYLNPASLEDALCDTRIQDGMVRSEDTLKNLLSGCQALYLTEPLTDAQWLRLLRRLQRLDAPPYLVDLTREKTGSGPGPQAGIRCQLYSHETTALTGLDAKTYRLTAQTQWSSLWQDTQLVSQKEMRFETFDTGLLQALKQGKPVAFHGLETCPELLARLESLLAHPPYLFINGQKIELPGAKVIFLWPEQVSQPESPLWQNTLRQASTSPQPTAEQHRLMAWLEALPPSTRKRYPARPPWQGVNFNALLEKQVEQERLEDGAEHILPIHHRKALHTLLVKAYRGDDEVYGYLKLRVRQLYPDQPPETAADAHALRQWLSQHPRVDRRLLKQHFWTLVRHCPIADFSGLLPGQFQPPGKEALDRLASYLVGAKAEQERTALAQSLKVSPKRSSGHQYYQGSRRTRLRDALLAAGTRRTGENAISEQVRLLDKQVGSVIEGSSHGQKLTHIKKVLGSCFPEDLLKDDFRDLAEALVLDTKGQRDRQQRRIRRLAGRVRQHPLVFLQGEAGAGKSHMARAVAGQLGQHSPPQVLSLGPETSAEQLFGQPVIQEDISDSDDASSAFMPGPVLRWAMNENPPILVLDEANLASEGVLAPLAGLMETPPRLSYQGKDYPLTDRHRVILTGNPDYYDGRHMDSAIKKHMLTLYYRPLDHGTLAECIIRPALPAHWPEPLKDQGTRAMLSLYRHYAGLLPDALSPRDLQDVLSRISQTLRHHQHVRTEARSPEPSPEQLNQLVFDAFSDSLGGRVPTADADRVRALGQWYKAHFSCDQSLTEHKQTTFQIFLEQLRNKNPDIDLNSAPVVNLVQKYWQFLDQQQDQPRGRRSLLVEGPAGWGKDLLLQRVLMLWQQQHPDSAAFVHINASPNQWDALVEKTKTAMTLGQKLVISELNLLPSRYLEGLFNEVLTSSTAHPDFALFATVNPSSFGGRETLSTAMKSRCTQVQLEPLAEPDLKGILNRRTNNLALAEWLSCRYQLLSEQLRQRNAPIQLSLDDLFRAADALGHTPEKSWPGVFKTTFGLALQSAGLGMEVLEKRLTKHSEPMDDSRSEREQQLSLTLNQEQPEPLTVRLLTPDAEPAWDAGRRTLDLPDIRNKTELLGIAHYILDLQSSPVAKPEDNRDHPTTRPPTTEPQDNRDHPTARPSTTEPQDNRNHPATRPPTTKPQDNLEYPTTSPPTTEPVSIWTLDGDITTHRHYEPAKFFAGEQFGTEDYRLGLTQMIIHNGELGVVLLPCDQGGVEKITPPGWPKGEVKLTETQQLGSGTFSLKHDCWTPLPGLSARDQLVYFQCVPEQPLEIARGKETGQLLVRLANTTSAPCAEVHLDFIIEPGQNNFTPLKTGDSIQTDDRLCDPLIRAWLKEELFSTKSRIHFACRELQSIKKIPDKATQLNALAQWCRRFEADDDVPGQGLNLLVKLIRQKQGTCRHRSQVFQVLSQYFGVPARMVWNTAHQYVEVSPDGGRCWRKIDLGGGGDATWKKHSQDHPANIHLPEVSEPFGKVDAFERDHIEKLLTLYREGAKRNEWSELIGDLNSRFPQYKVAERLIWVAGESTKNVYNLPWPEIFANWHRLARAEKHPVKQAEMLERLKDEVLKVIAVLYAEWIYEEIQDSDYFDTVKRCLPLIREGVAPAGLLLTVLESLASDRLRGAEAEQLLTDHYQQLTRPQTWPADLRQRLEQKRPEPYPDPGGYSRTLTRALQQTTIDRQWSAVATGAPPNLERMASRRLAFPLFREKLSERPVFLCLPFDVAGYEYLFFVMYRFFKNKPKFPASLETKVKKLAKKLFFSWLLQQDSKREWRTLCRRTQSGKQQINDGCYPSIRLLNPCTNICSSFVLDTQLDCMNFSELNPERVKKAFDEPDALVLTDDFLAICFREYLETMDYDKFIKWVSSKDND